MENVRSRHSHVLEGIETVLIGKKRREGLGGEKEDGGGWRGSLSLFEMGGSVSSEGVGWEDLDLTIWYADLLNNCLHSLLSSKLLPILTQSS